LLLQVAARLYPFSEWFTSCRVFLVRVSLVKHAPHGPA
jgi:hypothetical protein